jgi:hypothetical protein
MLLIFTVKQPAISSPRIHPVSELPLRPARSALRLLLHEQTLVAGWNDDAIIPEAAGAGMSGEGVFVFQARVLDVRDIENPDLTLMT